MERIYDKMLLYMPELRAKGYYNWKARVAGQNIIVKMMRNDIDAFANYDTSFIRREFPQDVDVLTIHGTADKTVPVEDARIYHDILSARRPGTHKLELVDGADHIYTGRSDDVVGLIVHWLESLPLITEAKARL